MIESISEYQTQKSISSEKQRGANPMKMREAITDFFRDMLGLFAGITSDAFKEFLKFATLGYLATFEPARYRQFGWSCERVWQSLWSGAEKAAGPNSWVMTAFSWVDVISKGGFVVRLIAIGILWTAVFYLIKKLVLTVFGR